MREMIKMVVVLTLLSSVSGGLLAALRNQTQDRIENQVLEFVKGPAIKAVLEGASNNPIADRFKIEDRSFFVGVFNGKPDGVAFETSGKGFGGKVGLMVGIDVNNDKLLGVSVTTHSETPGMGARAKTDLSFVHQFKGLAAEETFKVNQDGGSVNALSGATITSRAVCAATTEAGQIYKQLKPQIEEKLKAVKK
jgi:electron transport complex protein RnfG